MKVETDELTIQYNVKTCVHARRCVLGLPNVFDSERDPWIQPGETDTDALVEVIEACPSGALWYDRKTGPSEQPPIVNTVRLREKGPLELHGDLRIEGQQPRHRALLCRCGQTTNPPFCNNNHRGGFDATGLPEFRDDKDEDLERRDGPLEVSIREGGPMTLTGQFEIIGSDGRRVARMTKATLCRCGASSDKPFCDGSHRKLGWTKATGVED